MLIIHFYFIGIVLLTTGIITMGIITISILDIEFKFINLSLMSKSKAMVENFYRLEWNTSSSG